MMVYVLLASTPSAQLPPLSPAHDSGAVEKLTAGQSTRALAASPVQRSPPLHQASSSPAGSGRDGVFTPDQAARGQQTFQKVCSSCHKGAEQTGQQFEKRWGDSRLGDLFYTISTTMPQGSPGSLKPEEYADIIAFLLQENGYPPGKQDLPADIALLMKMPIERLAR